MAEVNSLRESPPSERDFEPLVQAQGAQPSAKNGRIPRLFRADQQTERLSTWAMLAEREGFELAVRLIQAPATVRPVLQKRHETAYLRNGSR
jgi:hypothetical protein